MNSLGEIREKVTNQKKFRVRSLTSLQDFLVLGYITNNHGWMAVVNLETAESQRLDVVPKDYVLLSSQDEIKVLNSIAIHAEESLIQTCLRLYGVDGRKRIVSSAYHMSDVGY